MPAFDHHGLSAHYHDTGRGDPVVLLHAGGSSGRQWEKLCACCPVGYRFLAPDLIGFGKTTRWAGPGDLTHDHQAELVSTLVEQHCDRPVHLVGHSYGGSTAVRFAIARPDRIKRLTLIEPNIVPLLEDAGEHEVFEEYAGVARSFIEDVAADRPEAAWQSFIDLRNGAGAWEALTDDRRASMLAQTGQMIDGFKSNLNNATTLSQCADLALPVMVICGGSTTRPERRISEILAGALPNCRYEIVAGAGHMSPLTHPGEVAALVLDHIAAHEDKYSHCA